MESRLFQALKAFKGADGCEANLFKEFKKIAEEAFFSPDFVIASPKNFRQRVWRFSDVLPSALFGCKPPCSEVA